MLRRIKGGLTLGEAHMLLRGDNLNSEERKLLHMRSGTTVPPGTPVGGGPEMGLGDLAGLEARALGLTRRRPPRRPTH